MTLTPPKDEQAAAIILRFLKTTPATHSEIVAATGASQSVASNVVTRLMRAKKVHICEYRACGYRQLKVLKAGAGPDAKKPTEKLAMTLRMPPLLELLATGDKTRMQITAGLKWGNSTTASVLLYMRENGHIHIARYELNSSKKEIPVYRAGAGRDATPATTIAKKQAVIPSAIKIPPRDPLMAALFG